MMIYIMYGDMLVGNVCVCVRVRARARVCVVRSFQQYFNHITTVAACCMRLDSARVFSAANTDAPYR